jgi:hypothetical protein
MSGTQSYAVYLTEAASDDADVDGGQLHADALDFYDSGVWVTHAGGRDFFPYERVLRIREGADEPAAEGDSERADETTGERRDAASGTAGTVDDTNLEVE